MLLILAGVSIAMLTGENGILTQAQRAKNETENAQADEENTLTSYEQIINASTGVTLETITGYETNNTVTQDSLGNRVVVPAGFRVVNPGDNVEDGIIIEDVSHGATAGSQFVWIPVGTFKTITGTGEETVKLSRYTFDSSENPTDQGFNVINNHYQELATSTYGNTTAKDIEGFKTSVTRNGGYYIGRYEARTLAPRTASTDDSGLTQITVKPNDYVYNYVTQPQAAERCQGMYTDTNYTSDLMNSYAWDTAIDFLQKCDDREGTDNKPYSQQNSLNTGSVATQGTNNQTTKDVICNIYDMASNCSEWTTETYNSALYPCARRGDNSYNGNNYTAIRFSFPTSASMTSTSFRPLLYL